MRARHGCVVAPLARKVKFGGGNEHLHICIALCFAWSLCSTSVRCGMWVDLLGADASCCSCLATVQERCATNNGIALPARIRRCDVGVTHVMLGNALIAQLQR